MEKLLLVSGLLVFTAFSMVNTKPIEALQEPAAVYANNIKEIIAEPVIEESKVPGHAELLSPEKKIVAAQTTEVVEVPVVETAIDTVPDAKLSFRHITTNINNDGTSKTSEVVLKDDNGKLYKIKKVNDKITEFYVNDVRIADADMASYKSVLDEIEVSMKRQEELTEQRRAEAKVRRDEMQKKREEMRARSTEMQEERRVQVQRDGEAMRRKTEAIRQRSEEMNEQRREQLQRDGDAMRKKTESLRQRSQEMNEQRNDQLRRDNEVLRQKTDALRERNEASRAQQSATAQRIRGENTARALKTTQSRNEISLIVNELVNENVVTDTDNLSFTINSNSLIVNGTKQSAALHSKLKEKFNFKEGDTITYTKNGNSTNTSINRN